MEMSEAKKARRKKSINHINRIIGQLEALRRLMETGGSCFEISRQMVTVRNSVNSLGLRTLEGFITHHLVGEENIRKKSKEFEELSKILDLYR